jgi:hypothetical protein
MQTAGRMGASPDHADLRDDHRPAERSWSVLSSLSLAGVPATTTISGWIAIRLIFHDSAIAWAIASLAGLFSFAAAVIASTEVQRTIRLWIYFRAEHRLSAAEAFLVRRQMSRATCGRRWTSAGAADIRQAAAAYGRSSGLPEIMRLTRLGSGAEELCDPQGIDAVVRTATEGSGRAQLVAVSPADPSPTE